MGEHTTTTTTTGDEVHEVRGTKGHQRSVVRFLKTLATHGAATANYRSRLNAIEIKILPEETFRFTVTDGRALIRVFIKANELIGDTTLGAFENEAAPVYVDGDALRSLRAADVVGFDTAGRLYAKAFGRMVMLPDTEDEKAWPDVEHAIVPFDFETPVAPANREDTVRYGDDDLNGMGTPVFTRFWRIVDAIGGLSSADHSWGAAMTPAKKKGAAMRFDGWGTNLYWFAIVMPMSARAATVKQKAKEFGISELPGEWGGPKTEKKGDA